MDFVCGCTKICKPMLVEPVLITKSVVWVRKNGSKFNRVLKVTSVVNR